MSHPVQASLPKFPSPLSAASGLATTKTKPSSSSRSLLRHPLAKRTVSDAAQPPSALVSSAGTGKDAGAGTGARSAAGKLARNRSGGAAAGVPGTRGGGGGASTPVFGTATPAAPAAGAAAGPLPVVPAACDLSTLVCEICREGHSEEQILLCDSCNRGFHLLCLRPPLSGVPEGDWLCPSCLDSGGGDVGVGPAADGPSAVFGGTVRFQDFERQANSFKRHFWGGESRARKVSP